jgi:glycosyltransferase involved in cell wall biosynthesis
MVNLHAVTEEPVAEHPPRDLRIAVVVPCLNESRTIGKVVGDFRRELPTAAIWVVDNGSTDDTAAIAKQAGAHVITEPRRGKGFAVRAGFRDVDADVYVVADGDDQVPADRVHDLVAPIVDGRADMVVGSRALGGREGSRPVNDLGNMLFSSVLQLLLGVHMTDVLSGYRALSRMLVKGVPLASRNFEIEVELNVKTTQRSYRLAEIPIQVRPRPVGSVSRLRVLGDGFRILWAILLLVRDYRPMAFFGTIGGLLLLLACWLYLAGPAAAAPTLSGTSIVAILVAVGGLLALAVGVVLSVLARRFTELEGKVDLAVGSGPRRGPDD